MSIHTRQQGLALDALAVLKQLVGDGDVWSAWEARNSMMESAGFEYLDAGCYSAVYSHPDTPDVVYKTTLGNNDGTLQLHQWMLTQSSPHLPVVHHIFQCTELDYNEREFVVGVIVVERLDPYDYRCGDPDNWEWGGMPSPIQETVALLEAACISCDDLHSGNIMIRPSNGCPVITDPGTDSQGAQI